MTPSQRRERGVTLVEVTIVMVLASLVMVGLVGFYLNAQTTWLVASSKALTQREGTMALDAISDSVRVAGIATVTPNPDAMHVQLTLFDQTGATELCRFWWDSADSMVHWGKGATDRGPLITPRVDKFEVVGSDSIVHIVRLDLIDPYGESIELSTSATMYNRP